MTSWLLLGEQEAVWCNFIMFPLFMGMKPCGLMRMKLIWVVFSSFHSWDNRGTERWAGPQEHLVLSLRLRPWQGLPWWIHVCPVRFSCMLHLFLLTMTFKGASEQCQVLSMSTWDCTSKIKLCLHRTYILLWEYKPIPLCEKHNGGNRVIWHVVLEVLPLT